MFYGQLRNGPSDAIGEKGRKRGNVEINARAVQGAKVARAVLYSERSGGRRRQIAPGQNRILRKRRSIGLGPGIADRKRYINSTYYHRYFDSVEGGLRDWKPAACELHVLIR